MKKIVLFSTLALATQLSVAEPTNTNYYYASVGYTQLNLDAGAYGVDISAELGAVIGVFGRRLN